MNWETHDGSGHVCFHRLPVAWPRQSWARRHPRLWQAAEDWCHRNHSVPCLWHRYSLVLAGELDDESGVVARVVVEIEWAP